MEKSISDLKIYKASIHLLTINDSKSSNIKFIEDGSRSNIRFKTKLNKFIHMNHIYNAHRTIETKVARDC